MTTVYANWNGLTPDNKQVSISHMDLAKWAQENDLHITVCWAHHFVMPEGKQEIKGIPAGTRLVRSRKAAEVQGWDDLVPAFPPEEESVA